MLWELIQIPIQEVIPLHRNSVILAVDFGTEVCGSVRVHNYNFTKITYKIHMLFTGISKAQFYCSEMSNNSQNNDDALTHFKQAQYNLHQCHNTLYIKFSNMENLGTL